MSKNRGTQFQGFAKALWDEIGKMQDIFCEECGTGPHSLARDMERAEQLDQSIQQLIARRAYDLACHVVAHLDEDVAWRKGKRYTASRIVGNDVPDMTEWPKESE